MTLEKYEIEITEEKILEAVIINEKNLSIFKANFKWLGLQSEKETKQFRKDCTKYNKAINNARKYLENYILLENPMPSEKSKAFWKMQDESDNFRNKYSDRIRWMWES